MSQSGRREPPKPPSFALLPALSSELAPEQLQEAQEFLSQIGAALFANAGPSTEQLTWSDAAVVSDPAAAGMSQLEQRLRQAEKRFRTLIEQIPAVTFMAVLGEGENEVYVSPHIERMLGYTQEQWLADPFLWYSRLHPGDRKLWNEEFARGCRTGGPFRAECRFLARNGDVVWVLGEARVVKDELGRPQFLQGVAFDISESKRAEQLVLSQSVQAARLEEDLQIARRLQTSILPTEPRLQGLDMAVAMHAAEQVGGDYYDVRNTADGGGFIAIGDVSGHGLNAGLVMVMVQSTMAALTCSRGDDASPAELVTLLNHVMFDNVRSRLRQNDYVTLCLLRYFRDGRVVFAGAHEFILICRQQSGTVERVQTRGSWISIARDIRGSTHDESFELHDGDLMLLYSDGLIEAMNEEGEQYDVPRLTARLQQLRAESAQAIRDAILDDVRRWQSRQEDDITLIVARYEAPAALPAAADGA
jgi:PAS domain S-box-containing protein